MFKVEVNQSKKILFITVGGFFKEDEGMAFLDEYNKAVKSITPSTYTLALEGESLSTSKTDMLPVLENCMKMYKHTGFKRIVSTQPSSASAFMQLKRLLSEINLKVDFVSNLSSL